MNGAPVSISLPCPFIKDVSITEVMINGPDHIFIEKNERVQRLNRSFESEKRLEDGSRVNVVLPLISLVGPVVTIRKFSKTPLTIEQLIRYGSITEEIAAVLKILVEAKYNIFISGGTGSGKTTFLNALSNYIPREERIIVGEVRGPEALDILQAMNTGHDESLSSGYANSTRDMLSRLETMVLQGASGMPLQAIRMQIASALDIIIHLSGLRDHSRKAMEITEVLGVEGGIIQHTFLGPVNQNGIFVCAVNGAGALDDMDGVVQGKLKFVPQDAGVYAEELVPILAQNQWSYYDLLGDKQFGEYQFAGSFQDGAAAVQTAKGWTLIDAEGKNVSDTVYQEIRVNKDGSYKVDDVMLAKKEGSYHLFDKKENQIGDFACDDVDVMTQDGIFAFQKNGKWGFADQEGNEIIKPPQGRWKRSLLSHSAL